MKIFNFFKLYMYSLVKEKNKLTKTINIKQIEKLAEVLQEKEEHMKAMNEKLSNITDNTTNNDSVLSIMEDALTEKVCVQLTRLLR